jgi:hypothetical protein
MELHEALSQISEIRGQMAQVAVFRGYRSLTIGCSGFLGVCAAIAQAIRIPHPANQLDSYLTLWVATAVVGATVVGAEMWFRALTSPSRLARQRTLFAVEQFAPCVVAGALLTAAIGHRAAESAWMLPGLWSIVFSLGMFASCRVLPRPMLFVGFYYLIGGTAVLFAGAGASPLSPWSMGLLFGGGQLLSAAILYLTLERSGYGRASEE